MDVGRLFAVHSLFHKIERLWSLETVFSKAPTTEGKRDTLARLEELRGMLDEVITELKTELEEEEWLA
jgi:hypothetical protein